MDIPRAGTEFSVCIGQSWSTQVKWIKDETAGRDKDIGLPSQSEEFLNISLIMLTKRVNALFNQRNNQLRPLDYVVITYFW